MDKLLEQGHACCNSFFYYLFKRELHKETFKQFIKHYLVGATNAVTNFIIFNLLILKMSTVMANTLAAIIVGFSAFFLHKHFTYSQKKHAAKNLMVFLMIVIIYYVLETALLILLIDFLQVIPPLSKILTIIMLSPCSFIVNKKFVFYS